MEKFKVIRDTKHFTGETIFKGSKNECKNWLNEVITLNNYTVKEFKTVANWLGFTVIKTPFNDQPCKIFYILED